MLNRESFPITVVTKMCSADTKGSVNISYGIREHFLRDPWVPFSNRDFEVYIFLELKE
jgi:hypothetical protein